MRQNKRAQTNVKNLLLLRDQAEHLYDLILKNKLNTKKLGELLHQGWKIKSKLSENVSNKFIDDNYNLVKKIGAYGGKLSGAGGGGFLSFVVKKNLHKKIIYSLKKKNMQFFPIKTETSGSIII